MASRLFFVTCASLTFACRVSQASLAGRYLERHEKGDIVLTLAADYTFVESLEPRGGSPAVARGRWTFNQNQSTVSLHGAVFSGHVFGDPRFRDYRVAERGGLWLLTAERGALGKVRLVDSPDFDLAFQRVSDRWVPK
jgi:hypothetical protein